MKQPLIFPVQTRIEAPNANLNSKVELALEKAQIPSNFRDELASLLEGTNILLAQELPHFVNQTLDWAQGKLGINLKPSEQIWLVDFMLKCRETLGLDESVTELISEAQSYRDKIRRGYGLKIAGDKALMASGNMAALKCQFKRGDRMTDYYAASAGVAYAGAGRALKLPELEAIAHSGRTVDFSDLLRASNFLFNLDFKKLFDLVIARNRKSSSSKPRLIY